MMPHKLKKRRPRCYLDEQVEFFGISFNEGQVAALYALIHRVFETVLRHLHEAGGLVQGQAEREDVGLRELFAVDVIGQKFGRHVAAIALFGNVFTENGRHVTEVPNLVGDSVIGTGRSGTEGEAGVAARRMPRIGRLVAAEVTLAGH